MIHKFKTLSNNEFKTEMSEFSFEALRFHYRIAQFANQALLQFGDNQDAKWATSLVRFNHKEGLDTKPLITFFEAHAPIRWSRKKKRFVLNPDGEKYRYEEFKPFDFGQELVDIWDQTSELKPRPANLRSKIYKAYQSLTVENGTPMMHQGIAGPSPQLTKEERDWISMSKPHIGLK